MLPSYERWGDLTSKRVLVRADFNTPLIEVNGEFEVVDDFRIRATVPLLQDLLERGAAVTVCTHLGRPNGRVDPQFSIAPLKRRLDQLCPGIEMMENLRFHEGEEANDQAFGASLVEGFDYYINEAFGVSHRAHASIMVPPTLVPSAAGPHLRREVETLLALLENPLRPFVAIIGGAKVADKLGIANVLAQKADMLVVGGGMAYTFEKSIGRSIGDSLCDDSFVEKCAVLMQTGRVRIPVDSRGLATGEPFGRDGGTNEVIHFAEEIPYGYVGLDIGPHTIEEFSEVISTAGTILWNGPMGVFEDDRFAIGTVAVARAIAASKAVSVVGGGDSVAALSEFGLEGDVNYVSTGGGASLELIEHGDLPGLRALRESKY